MDQIKLTSGKLLNVYGNLNQAGYATSLVKEAPAIKSLYNFGCM